MHENTSVLHVDDEPSFTDLVQTFLERQNERFDIETAHRVDEALDCIAENGLDCIVSDYDMPGKMGSNS
jgi:DNA-binding NtrC family response regulator